MLIGVTSMGGLLAAAGLGLGLGVVTGMPLGVVNIAIVDAASAGNRRFATGLGIGGAAADAIHAAVAFVGVGRLVTSRPDVLRILAGASAALIVGYALVTWRRRVGAPAQGDARGHGHEGDAQDHGSGAGTQGHGRGGTGAMTGFLLTLPNPGALSAWVAVAAAVWPAATIAEAVTVGASVGIGSAAWFAFLAWITSKIPREHRALRIIPRVALVALIGIAVVGVVRAL